MSPQKFKDESGAEVEAYTQAELDAAKAESEAKVKALEEEINPNWREARHKMSEQERLLAEKDRKLAELGHKEPVMGLSAEDAAKIAVEKADEVYLGRYRERILSRFGDKKDAIKAYFDKLAAGEKLDEAKIDQYVNDAARAVGVRSEPDRDVMAQYGRGGASPIFPTAPVEGQDGFAATQQGKATAAAMGLIIEPPKK
jgi:hypothetical protein